MIKGAKLVVDNLGVDIDGHCIVDGVNFCARPGDVVGILGPNGSGKSTILRSIFHSRKPARGICNLRWSRRLVTGRKVVGATYLCGPAGNTCGVSANLW